MLLLSNERIASALGCLREYVDCLSALFSEVKPTLRDIQPSRKRNLCGAPFVNRVAVSGLDGGVVERLTTRPSVGTPIWRNEWVSVS